MPTEDRFESARKKFLPDHVKILFVAEAPPALDAQRFFYFVPVMDGDTLFLELMKVLFHDEFLSTRNTRQRKREFLTRFQNDGFYLIDACRLPLPKRASSSQKKRIIGANLPFLKAKITELKKLNSLRSDTKIILIGRPVYDVCVVALKNFHVINSDMIDFPATGRQKQFRQKLAALLKA
jgi:hypothetical protein